LYVLLIKYCCQCSIAKEHLTHFVRQDSTRSIPVAARSKGVSLRVLAGWDCGFETRRGQGYLTLVSVACCKVEVSATGRSLVQRSSTKCACVCVTVCDQCNNNHLHHGSPTRDPQGCIMRPAATFVKLHVL